MAINLQRAGLYRRVFFPVFLAAILASGCGRKSGTEARVKVERKPLQEPARKSPIVPLGGDVEDLDLTLTDKKGTIVARVKAAAGTVGQTSATGGEAGALRVSSATLYEKGRPAATLMADQIVTDQATRTITGKGNVVAKSLIQAGSPTVRADTMIWRHNENTLRGKGHVLVTRDSGIRVPGKSFVADTKLRHVHMQPEDSPATARF